MLLDHTSPVAEGFISVLVRKEFKDPAKYTVEQEYLHLINGTTVQDFATMVKMHVITVVSFNDTATDDPPDKYLLKHRDTVIVQHESDLVELEKPTTVADRRALRGTIVALSADQS